MSSLPVPLDKIDAGSRDKQQKKEKNKILTNSPLIVYENVSSPPK